MVLMVVLAGVAVTVELRTVWKRLDRLEDNILDLERRRYLALVHARRSLPAYEPQCVREGRHRQTLTESEAEYDVVLAGQERPFREQVTIENLGPDRANNVRLFVNGRTYPLTTGEIVEGATRGLATDEEKAIALWRYVCRRRYHWWPAEHAINGGLELHNPVKFFNVYGYGHCDDAAANLAMLCRAAGLQARVWLLRGHVVAEVFYNQAWHMFDADTETFYPKSHRGGPASVEEIARQPWLAIRTPHPFLEPQMTAETIASNYAEGENRLYDLPSDLGHRMALGLRPGERFTVAWHAHDWAAERTRVYVETPVHVNWWEPGQTPFFHTDDYTNLPPFLVRATFTFDPGQVAARPRAVFAACDNVSLVRRANGPPLWTCTDPRKPGLMLVANEFPFVIVGGEVFAEFCPSSPDDTLVITVNARPDAHTEPREPLRGEFSGAAGRRWIHFSLNSIFAHDLPVATYRCGIGLRFTCANSGPFGVRGLKIVTHCQASPLSPWTLRPGRNAIRLTRAKGNARIRVDHTWWSDEAMQVVRSGPTDVQVSLDSEGRLALHWQHAATSDGRPPAGYHVCVSERRDFLWPVAPGFEAEVAGPFDRWRSPPGFLRAGVTYYCKVAAKNPFGLTRHAPVIRDFRF